MSDITDIIIVPDHTRRPATPPEVIELRRQFVMDMIVKGYSLSADIMREWNEQNPAFQVSQSTIENDRSYALNRLQTQTTITAMQVRDLIGTRLNNVARTLQPRVDQGSLGAIDRYLRTLSQLAELYGANMPAKIAFSDISGTKDAPELTAEERVEALRQILEKVKYRKEIEES